MKKHFQSPYQMWTSFGLLTFVVLQMFALPIIWEKHHESVIMIFIAIFVVTSMIYAGHLGNSLTQKGKEDLLVFSCGVFMIIILTLFSGIRLSAQNIDSEVKNSLITDFNKFVSVTTNCNSKTPECEGINSKYVSKYNTSHGTNHRTLWDIYVNISAVELQKILLSQPTKMRGSDNNVSVNSNQVSQLTLLKAKNDTLLLLLRNKSVEVINLTNDNLLKDSIIVSQRAEISGMEKYAISCELILSNDVLITHKGLYINTRNDKLISKQFVEENRELIEKVSTGVYIYKPSKGLDTPTIIQNAVFHKKRLLSVDWKRVAISEHNNLATK